MASTRARILAVSILLAACSKAPTTSGLSTSSSASGTLSGASSTSGSASGTVTAATDSCVTKSTAWIPPDLKFTADDCGNSDVRLRQRASNGAIADFSSLLNEPIQPYVVATITTDGGSGLPYNVFVISARSDHLLMLQFAQYPGESKPSWKGPGDITNVTGYTMSSISYAAVVIGGVRQGTFWNGTYSPAAYVGNMALDGTYVEGVSAAGAALTIENVGTGWLPAAGHLW